MQYALSIVVLFVALLALLVVVKLQWSKGYFIPAGILMGIAFINGWYVCILSNWAFIARLAGQSPHDESVIQWRGAIWVLGWAISLLLTYLFVNFFASDWQRLANPPAELAPATESAVTE